MRRAIFIILVTLLWGAFIPHSFSQEISNDFPALSLQTLEGFTDALKCIKMTPVDLMFRDDYVDLDSFRLELIDKIMQHPLDIVKFNSNLRSDWEKASPRERRFILPFDWSEFLKTRGKEFSFSEIKPSDQDINSASVRFIREYGKSTKKLPEPLRNVISSLLKGIESSNFNTQKSFSDLTVEERNCLRDSFSVILLEDINDEFKTPEELDAQSDYEEKLIEKMIPYLSKIDIREIVEGGKGLASATGNCLPGLLEFVKTKPQIKPLVKDKKDKENDLILRLQTHIGEIIIGGYGSSRYVGSPAIIIDLGGDDEYHLSANPSSKFNSSVIIDLGGNDIYNSVSDYTYGSGFFGSGILIDVSGDDTYLTKNFSLGSGLFGTGLLIDEQGNDKYFGDTFTMGAGSFGMGGLIDLSGSDQYSAALYVQGFGFTGGMGILIDSSGNDSYFAGGKYKDILRYKDHYISLSQGFAYGLRPIMSGGIGILYDITGNDLYTSDIFGQGSSYWWSLGTLMDREGNDKYVSYQYAQGAGTHLTLGVLEDSSGNDIYISHGVSQGCGHDLALGLLLDRSGNDNYITYDLSQGAGSANGFGILVDEAGNDGYSVGRDNNTQGFGNPRRDYGSIGIILDLSGRDRYNGNGKDSTWWTTPSKWGVGIDK
ncbi:MAG: hypothetical protein ABII96_08420 [Candidatus Zixiibacteriota bacterium]